MQVQSPEARSGDADGSPLEILKNMLNNQVLTRIAQENGVDPVAARQSAEQAAQPQSHKCWGLTDSQSDVIAELHSQGQIQAVVNLAVNHFRQVNHG